MKHLIYFTLGFTLLLLVGCASFNRVSYNGYRAISSPEVTETIERNDIYIHDGKETYKVLSPSLKDSSIYGKLEKVTRKSKIDSLQDNNLELKKKDPLVYAVNLYVSDPVSSFSKNSSSDQESKDSTLNNTENSENHLNQSDHILDLKDVDRVEAYAADSNRLGMILLIVIGGIITVGLIVWLLIIALVKGTEASGEASSESSAESSAESSGGDGGSCYIATMTYGSYDAPEVLVLRSFRDKFLNQFYLGRKFISLYYKYAPGFVDKHKRNYRIHKIIRSILNRFVFVLKKLNF